MASAGGYGAEADLGRHSAENAALRVWHITTEFVLERVERADRHQVVGAAQGVRHRAAAGKIDGCCGPAPPSEQTRAT